MSAETTVGRLRGTVDDGTPDDREIDAWVIASERAPLTYGDARALLALVEAVKAWNDGFDAPESDDPIARDIVMDDLRDKMDAALTALTAPTRREG